MRVLIYGTVGEGKSTVAEVIRLALARHGVDARVLDDDGTSDHERADLRRRVVEGDPRVGAALEGRTITVETCPIYR